MALLGILIYAEIDYNGFYDENMMKTRFRFICGFDAEDILDLEQMNYPGGRNNSELPVESDYVKTSYALLYNDPLLGMADKYIEGIDACAFYKKMYEDFQNRGTNDGLFGPAFQYIKNIMYLLSVRADYGIRLKKAYEEQNPVLLGKLSEEAGEIGKLYDDFKAKAREFYLYYHKALGSEVMELHNATMVSRFATVVDYLEWLKKDPAFVIEELEEERMYLVPPGQKTEPQYGVTNYQFSRFYSATGLTKLLVVGW